MKPALFVTTEVPPDRVGAFQALAARTPVEFALFGGGLHATGGVGADVHGLPARIVTQREVYGLAASGDYRAVLAGTAGRTALPAAWLGAERARIPFVLWTALWAHPRSVAHAPGALLLRLLYRRASTVVTYGEHVSRFAEAHGARDPIVAPQAVDQDFWGGLADEPPPAGTPPRILYVGRDDPGKGVGTLLEAWERGGFAVAGAELVLAGPDASRASETAGVTALGLVSPERVRQELRDSVLLVVPSERTATFREPWGLVVNEAMHARRLVAASTQVGAVAGGLVEDERTGLVFRAGDPAALAAALHRGLEDAQLRGRLASAGHERARLFSWDAWAATVARALGGSLA
ncbi:MAG: glycosyltransferase family 4 protein [Solirubrobacteraceae bacterium]|nr:glycosyltransferase family 4 protein [Solirubrobacteraceae bacterium]